jgi:hypothetical protein
MLASLMGGIVGEAVGNVGIAWFWAISKGGGKGGKPGLGFPCFPRTVISTAYLSVDLALSSVTLVWRRRHYP